MKKPEKLTRGEELLAQALEECLDEDLSFTFDDVDILDEFLVPELGG